MPSLHPLPQAGCDELLFEEPEPLETEDPLLPLFALTLLPLFALVELLELIELFLLLFFALDEPPMTRQMLGPALSEGNTHRGQPRQPFVSKVPISVQFFGGVGQSGA